MNNKKLLCLSIFGALFIYLILRGIHVQMLHDSIATFFRYVYINKFLPYHSEWSANNHFLNSMLMWVSYKLFGSSALALKLPNILSFPLYAFFIYKIAGLLKNPFLFWGFFISMLFAHNYFEFFGTGRGYGMSMAFLAGGIWHTMLALQSFKTKDFIIAMIFLALASYANLTIINSFIILLGILILASALHTANLRRSIINYTVLILLGIVPIALLIVLLFKMQAMGELYYGEPEGLFQVSVKSLAKLLTGSSNVVIPYVALCFFVVFVLIYLYIALRKKGKGYILHLISKQHWIFFFLLIGNIAACYLEHVLFGTDFPEDRTGLFLYPLFIGTIFFGLSQISFNKNYYAIIPVLPLLFFPLHFAYNANLSWSSLENHSIPERFYEKVASDHEKGSYPPTIAAYRSRIMRWNHLNFRNQEELSCISFSSYPSVNADFMMVNQEEAPEYFQVYDSIDCERNSKILLLKRKQKLNKKLYLTKSNVSSKDNITNTFFELYNASADSLRNNTIYIGFKLNFVSLEKPFHAWIVAAISDKDNIDIRYEFIPFYWFRCGWESPDKTFVKGFLISSIPEKAAVIKVYIWNIGGKPYTVKNFDMEIFQLEQDKR